MDAKNERVYPMTMASFNPRARDGREQLIEQNDAILNVSIHAPVMDANL